MAKRESDHKVSSWPGFAVFVGCLLVSLTAAFWPAVADAAVPERWDAAVLEASAPIYAFAGEGGWVTPSAGSYAILVADEDGNYHRDAVPAEATLVVALPDEGSEGFGELGEPRVERWRAAEATGVPFREDKVAWRLYVPAGAVERLVHDKVDVELAR